MLRITSLKIHVGFKGWMTQGIGKWLTKVNAWHSKTNDYGFTIVDLIPIFVTSQLELLELEVKLVFTCAMKVFRGRLVHSIDAHKDIQVLEDRLIGIQEHGGKVSLLCKKIILLHRYQWMDLIAHDSPTCVVHKTTYKSDHINETSHLRVGLWFGPDC